ncbi:MAG: hypothetical protein ABIO94_11910 [Opitutaceae bacterium]
MTHDEAHALLDSTAAKLSEYFSSVQIVATQILPAGSTQWHAAGNGDWYARKAACQEFVERDQAATVAQTIRDVNQ